MAPFKEATVALLMVLAATAPARAQESIGGSRPALPCAAPEFRQFDFWAGDWDTYDMAEPTRVLARNHVTPMLDGCALREVYQQSDGLRGESFSAWVPARKTMHQSWVTNRGTVLLLDGRLEGGRMVMTGTDVLPGGTPSLLRGIWWTEGRTVRERAERSSDGGKTWTPVFDIVFRPHEPT